MSHPYTPGRAYELGYSDRLQGKGMDGRVMQSDDNAIFKDEYVRGWNDANARIIDEAKKKMETRPLTNEWTSNGSFLKG
jgi:hypothetical protein